MLCEPGKGIQENEGRMFEKTNEQRRKPYYSCIIKLYQYNKRII